MAKRFKPTVRSICVLGTLAHNRPFSPREISEYTRFENMRKPINVKSTIAWLRKHGHIESAGRGKWYPTAKGWKMIEKACRR